MLVLLFSPCLVPLFLPSSLHSRYQKKAKQVRDAEIPVFSRYDHPKQLEARLDFLDYILSSSTCWLTAVGIDRLFEVCCGV